MLFPSSRPHRIPQSTADSQYDTTTGYSSSSYTKWPRATPKTELYTVRNGGSNMNPSTRQYQINRRRTTNLNDSFTDTPAYEYFRPKEQEPIYSTNNSERPTVNYLLP